MLWILKLKRAYKKKSLNNKLKIKAFTLNEMIVVIILTSIVVGIAFSVLSLVQKHMLSIQINFNKNQEINKLEQSLWIDFNRYSKIKYDRNKDELIFMSAIDSTNYKFSTNYIIKETDTFNIQLQNKLFFLGGKKTNQEQIDAIKIETSEKFQNQILFVFKQNDATTYMN